MNPLTLIHNPDHLEKGRQTMYRLLLADDEKEIRNGLSQYFPWNEVGFDLIGQCENGMEVLQFIESHPIDVLLCDIRMPVMSGIDVARQLHHSKSNIKVVFLSGYKDFEYAKQALVYDVKGYIVKPTKYTELFEVFSALKIELDHAVHSMAVPTPQPSGSSFNEQVIATIKEYVEQAYATANLAEAAQLVHMNPHYVSKYFKDKTGVNFSDYIVSVRMSKAAELLKDIRYKTYEVSELVGYSYAKNFSRTFKKIYGVSPREYRNNFEQAKGL